MARLHSYFLSVGCDYKSAMSAVLISLSLSWYGTEFNKIRPPHSCAEARLIKFYFEQQRIQSVYLVHTSLSV